MPTTVSSNKFSNRKATTCITEFLFLRADASVARGQESNRPVLGEFRVDGGNVLLHGLQGLLVVNLHHLTTVLKVNENNITVH